MQVGPEQLLDASHGLDDLWPASVPSFLERVTDALLLLRKDVYSAVPLEPLQSLQLGITNLLKKLFMEHFSVCKFVH